jgi:hypothetical protein
MRPDLARGTQGAGGGGTAALFVLGLQPQRCCSVARSDPRFPTYRWVAAALMLVAL